MENTIIISSLTGIVCYLIGYQVSATRIWKIFIEITRDFPEDKMADWTKTLEENKPKLFDIDFD